MYAELIGRLKCDSIEQAGKLLKIDCPMQGEFKMGQNWAEIH